MAPLALVPNLATRLPWNALLALSVSIEFVSSSARVRSVMLQQSHSVSQWETTGPIDRTPGTGSDKNNFTSDWNHQSERHFQLPSIDFSLKLISFFETFLPQQRGMERGTSAMSVSRRIQGNNCASPCYWEWLHHQTWQRQGYKYLGK